MAETKHVTNPVSPQDDGAKRLQAVLFDLDGTLRHNDPPGTATFHRMAAEMGVAASSDQRLASERWLHAYWAGSDELREDLAAAAGKPGVFWRRHAQRHLRHLGASEDRLEEVADAITRRMLREYLPVDRVPAEALSTLSLLRTLGYRLGVVSNREQPLDDALDGLGMRALFDLSLAAGEIGVWKPDPRLLLHAVSRLDVQPDRAAYVGDNYFADVACARDAGLVPILLDPGQLFPEADCPVIRSIPDLPILLESLDGDR